MTIRVIINGIRGKMGSLAAQTLQQNAAFDVVAGLGHGDDLASTIKETVADVVVDLTVASAVFDNVSMIVSAKARPVVGTSGLLPEQIESLQARCKTEGIGGVIAPNFSIGAVLMMQCATKVAKYLSEAEVIEMHHNAKQDSPSGTALKTAAMIAESRTTMPKELVNEKETIPGARGAVEQAIHIHSVRLPGLVAHQQVMFGGTGETLTLRHDSINRECFMPGIVLACQKVMQLNELIYGLEHILD